AAVQAAEDYRERVQGALLVAPADPDKFGVAGALPEGPLGFPATLVASANDPWLSVDKAFALALRWGADFVDLGAAGHINAESGFGPWPFGLSLLRQLETRRVWEGGRGAGGTDPVPAAGRRLVTPEAAAALAKWREQPARTRRARSSGSEATIADDVSGFVASPRSAWATVRGNPGV
ncbi:MAG: RBBP9/YdeN family alpha/beta hydrolase, partial [Hyphomicrobium sp.]